MEEYKSLDPILFIDDDEVFRMSAERTFEEYKITNPLIMARNGQEAWDKLKGLNGEERISPTPKLIMLDLHMPIMDGHELLKMIRADEGLKGTLVMILTTSSNLSDVEKAYEKNVAGYMIKPIEIGEIIKAVRSLNKAYLNIKID